MTDTAADHPEDAAHASSDVRYAVTFDSLVLGNEESFDNLEGALRHWNAHTWEHEVVNGHVAVQVRQNGSLIRDGYIVHVREGRTLAGYCADDALPGERAAIEFLHAHAYEWALTAEGADRELAEEYAAWSVKDAWHPGAVVLVGSHRRDFQRFLATR